MAEAPEEKFVETEIQKWIIIRTLQSLIDLLIDVSNLIAIPINHNTAGMFNQTFVKRGN